MNAQIESGEIKRLRDKFRAVCAPAGTENALKKILMVGALKDEDDRLCSYDVIKLHGTFNELKKLSIPVSPDFDLSIVNLAYGDDFLAGEYAADLAIICYIYDPDDQDWPVTSGGGDLRISTRHFDDNIWQKTVERTGAKVLSVFGSHTEINERHFRNGLFKLTSHIKTAIPQAVFLRRDPSP